MARGHERPQGTTCGADFSGGLRMKLRVLLLPANCGNSPTHGAGLDDPQRKSLQPGWPQPGQKAPGQPPPHSPRP
eukprot:11313350-Alexandrium_andersonii.AAC.1